MTPSQSLASTFEITTDRIKSADIHFYEYKKSNVDYLVNYKIIPGVNAIVTVP